MNIVYYDPDDGPPTIFFKDQEYQENCKLICQLLSAPEPEFQAIYESQYAGYFMPGLFNVINRVIIKSV